MDLDSVTTAAQRWHDALAAPDGHLGLAESLAALAAVQQVRNVLDACTTRLLADVSAIEQVIGNDGEVGERHRGVGFEAEGAPELVAPLLGVSVQVAAARMGDAVDLLTRTPVLVEQMAAGALDAFRARVVLDEVADAPAEVAAQVAGHVVERARAGGGWTESPGPLRRRVAAILARVAPQVVADRQEHERARRGLVRRLESATLDRWEGCYGVEDSRQAWAAIDQLARAKVATGEADTLTQARADAHMELLLGQVTTRVILHATLTDPHLDPDPSVETTTDKSGRPHDGVEACGDGEVEDPTTACRTDQAATKAGTVGTAADASTEADVSAGASKDTATDAGAATEAEQAGRRPAARAHDAGSALLRHAPTPAATPAADSTSMPDPKTMALTGFGGPGEVNVSRAWLAMMLTQGQASLGEPVVCHPGTGALTDAAGVPVIEDGYRPSAGLRRQVITRDGHCRFPNCSIAARFCDIDHVIPWPQGPTTLSNLMLACRRHHRLKHATWRARLHPDGVIDWVDPLGRAHRTEPVDHTGATLPTPSPQHPDGNLGSGRDDIGAPVPLGSRGAEVENWAFTSPLTEHLIRTLADHGQWDPRRSRLKPLPHRAPPRNHDPGPHDPGLPGSRDRRRPAPTITLGEGEHALTVSTHHRIQHHRAHGTDITVVTHLADLDDPPF